VREDYAAGRTSRSTFELARELRLDHFLRADALYIGGAGFAGVIGLGRMGPIDGRALLEEVCEDRLLTRAAARVVAPD
jgi:hypothetical protein